MVEKYHNSVLLYLFTPSIALIREADSIFLSHRNGVLLFIMSSKSTGTYETAVEEAVQDLLVCGAPEVGLGKGVFDYTEDPDALQVRVYIFSSAPRA
jgi:hypothetical protein